MMFLCASCVINSICLTEPIKFVIGLDVPQEPLEVIEQDHAFSELVDLVNVV